ncbi:DUF2177 family protein [soil metagenome]
MFNLQYLIAYAATAVVFLGFDAVWLTLMADRLYRPNLGPLLLERYSATPALLFYVIYMVGLVTFAVAPALHSGKWTTALIHGALFGLCAYATYDLTNQATLRDWPVIVTVADLCWGTFVSAAAAMLGYRITTWAAAAMA